MIYLKIFFLEMLSYCLPIMLTIAFYAIYIYRPLQRKKILITHIEPGLKIITESGIVGTIHSLGNTYCIIIVHDGGQICVLKSSIARIVNE